MRRRPSLGTELPAGGSRVAVDLIVAAAVTVLTVADVSSASAEAPPWERPADGIAYALVAAGSLSLVWRRRAPLAVLAIVSVVVITFWLRDHGAFLSVLGLTTLYAAAAHSERRAAAWWTICLSCAAMLATASVTVLPRPDGFLYPTAISMTAFLAGAVVAGVVVRNRQRIFVDTERRADAAEADRLAEAERAVRNERSRIAREMHDVVAHGMSVVAVQAAAGQAIVHADPDKAAEVFARIEAVGRESLTELRRMLGVLREADDEQASLAPQPGIGDIAAVVDEAARSGVRAQLVVEGPARRLAPGVELAAFRIVQEALTNVRKHAGRSATARVRLVFEPRVLTVEVTDDGHGAATALAGVGTGHGLIGMRERVEIYGGDLCVGPRPGGGYAVRAVLPVADAGTRASSPVAAQPSAGTGGGRPAP